MLLRHNIFSILNKSRIVVTPQVSYLLLKCSHT